MAGAVWGAGRAEPPYVTRGSRAGLGFLSAAVGGSGWEDGGGLAGERLPPPAGCRPRASRLRTADGGASKWRLASWGQRELPAPAGGPV